MYQFLAERPGTQDESALSGHMAHLEEKYQFVFPAILKDYYLRYNGVRIKLCTLSVDGYSCEVARIIPVMAERMSFALILDRNRKDAYLSSRLFPLAMDRGGNLYYWDADTEGVVLVLADDVEHPFPVAKSVQEFFVLLDAASDV